MFWVFVVFFFFKEKKNTISVGFFKAVFWTSELSPWIRDNISLTLLVTFTM